MKTMKLILVLATVLSVTNISADVVVTPTNVIGPIKPMNGVNNGPVWGNRIAYRNIAIPYARTHDASFCSDYGGDHAVDITAIFPNFDNDEKKAESYDFTLTDKYLHDIMNTGTKVFFRLGQRIEHNRKKYGIYPPKDYKKWARICEHIIRHYNEGWAEGYKMNIEYWEIWNEADLDEETWNSNPCTWGGTEQQFMEFYEVVAKHLKKCFPKLKIGGPALSGKEPWGERFLDYMQNHHVELDFFSWHEYGNDPNALATKSERMRNALDQHGYNLTESILNEWNYIRNWEKAFDYSLKEISSQKAAAFVMATMMACQNKPVDMLMYYDARVNTRFNGLFNFYTQRQQYPYYAFYAWKHLAEYGHQIEASTNDKDIYVTAVKNNKGRLAVLICRYTDDDNVYSPESYKLKLTDIRAAKAIGHITDDISIYTETPIEIVNGETTIQLYPNSFIMIDIEES